MLRHSENEFRPLAQLVPSFTLKLWEVLMYTYKMSSNELREMFRRANGRVKLVTTGTDLEHEVLNASGEVIHATS